MVWLGKRRVLWWWITIELQKTPVTTSRSPVFDMDMNTFKSGELSAPGFFQWDMG